MGKIQGIVILIAVTRVIVWSKQEFCSKPAVFLATKGKLYIYKKYG